MEPKKKDFLDYIIPLIGVVIIFFLSLHMAISYEVVKNEPIIKEIETETGIEKREQFDYVAFFNDFSNRVTNHIDEIELVDSTPKFVSGSALLCLMVWGYFATSKKKLINGKEYGTAEWATEKDIKDLTAAYISAQEIKKVKHSLKYLFARDKKKKKITEINKKYEDADMLLTATERISIYNFKVNINTLIIGGSGSGKTRGYVMPNLLMAHASWVVTDPKGEILEKSGYFLEKVKGYKIRVLNLDEKTLSSGYNPFVYIHKDRAGWEERVLSLIETIIINTDGGEKKGGSDPFWDKAERLFLQAVFFFTVEGFPPEQSNMNTIIELIRMLKIEEEQDTLNSDLDIFCDCFAEKYGENHIGVQQYREFREKASGKTAKSIVISAVARLAPFKVKEVRRIFSYDAMHLERVGEEKTAVFVIVPPTDKTYNFIAGMLFTQLFQEIQYCALTVHKHDGQRLPVPCRFILDEFANTCTIPNFVSILAYARSLGVGITTILQSLDQIKNMYKDEWGVIIDNSNSLLYLGKVTNMDTLEYLSKLLGKGTYDKQSTSRTKGRQSSSSTNNDRLGRELLDASEIRKMKDNKCLLIVGGRNPFYSKKFDYASHKNYKYTSDGDKSKSYHYEPEIQQTAFPHGEEVKQDYRPPIIEVEELVAEVGREAINNYLSTRILQMDFDDELLIVNDGEHDELLLFAEIEEEDSTEKNLLNEIVSAVVECTTDSVSVIAACSSLIKKEIENPQSVEFDEIEVNDGELLENIEFNEEEEMEPINLTLAEIGGVISELQEDMNEFSAMLDDIDLSKLTKDSLLE